MHLPVVAAWSVNQVSWDNWVKVTILVAFLLIAAVIDVYTEKVPNWLTIPVIALGVIFNPIAGAISPPAETSRFIGAVYGLGWAFWGLAVGFFPLFVIFMLRGIRGGDVKTVSAVGAVSASAYCVLHTLMWGVVGAVVLAFIVMLYKGILKQTLTRIFLELLMIGAKKKPSFEERPDDVRIPYAVGFLAGIIIGGGPHLLGMEVFLA